MTNNASPKRPPAHQGMKTIITAASVAATLGGWAVFANQPLPNAAAASAPPVVGQAPSTTQTNPNNGLVPSQQSPQQPSLGQSGNGSSQTPFTRRGRRSLVPGSGSTAPSTGSTVPSFGGGQAPMARSRSSR